MQGGDRRGRRRLIPAKASANPGHRAHEAKSVHYAVRQMEQFRGKRLLVAWRRTALDWTSILHLSRRI